MLSKGANVNIYVFHGGTSFGFKAGSNSGPFQPCPTSYDYDAPITEVRALIMYLSKISVTKIQSGWWFDRQILVNQRDSWEISALAPGARQPRQCQSERWLWKGGNEIHISNPLRPRKASQIKVWGSFSTQIIRNQRGYVNQGSVGLSSEFWGSGSGWRLHGLSDRGLLSADGPCAAPSAGAQGQGYGVCGL